MKPKRHLLVLVGVPLLVAVAVVGGRSAWHMSGQRKPALECPEMLDLGERDRGEIALCQFRVRNSGRALLTLDQFQTSCSCTGIERTVDGHSVGVRSVELGPKQDLELTARMAISAPQGQSQVVYVHFRTNDPAEPAHHIQIVVPRVRGGVYALPKAVVFGSIRVGDRAVRVLDLYDTGMIGRQVATAQQATRALSTFGTCR